MASFQHALISRSTRALIQNLELRHSDVTFMRRWLDRFTSKLPLPLGTATLDVSLQHVKGEWLYPTGADKTKVLYYLHGGGYAVGSIKTHHSMVAKIAQLAGISAFMIDYRMAPEHPFPAGIEDAMEGYDYLLSKGFLPENIIVAGDSAGGGLAACLLLALKNADRVLPKAGILICPWTDLALTGQSIWKNKGKDPVLDCFDIPAWVKMYVKDHNPYHPLISPLHADLHGLPDLLLQVSEDELLADDGMRFGWKAHESGVKIEVQKWQGLMHVWHLFWMYMPEAKDALDQITLFIRQHFNIVKTPA